MYVNHLSINRSAFDHVKKEMNPLLLQIGCESHCGEKHEAGVKGVLVGGHFLALTWAPVTCVFVGCWRGRAKQAVQIPD